MPTVLLATDADWIHDEVDAALTDDDTVVERVRSGREVIAAVARLEPVLVVLDLQIGNMGGFATCLNLRQEESSLRLKTRPILMLLDRHDDQFMAKRMDADGWLIKPLDAFRLRKAAHALRTGYTWFEAADTPAPA